MSAEDIEMHEQNDPQAYSSDRVDVETANGTSVTEVGTTDPTSPTNPEMPRDGEPDGS